MTEGRGSGPPRKRGGEPPDRADPQRSGPARRPAATEGSRAGAKRSSSTPRDGEQGLRKAGPRKAVPRKAAPRKAGPAGAARRDGKPAVRKAVPGEAPRNAAAQQAAVKKAATKKAATKKAPARSAATKKNATPKAAPVNARKATPGRPAPRRARAEVALSTRAEAPPRRTGGDGGGRRTGGARRTVVGKASGQRSGGPAGKRPPQSRRPPAPRRPKRRRPPRTLKLGRPAVRLRITFGVMAFVLSLFAGRLVLLQGVDPDSYALAATKENTKPFVLHASRGAILDRNGAPLSVSEDAVAITADPTQTSSVAPELAAMLAPRLTGTTYDKLLAAMTRNGRFVYLARQVSPQVWNAISQELKDRNAAKSKAGQPLLTGIYTEADPIRSHPNGTLAANVVGIVGADGQGLAGLEYGLNDQLSGKDGKAYYEVDAKGNRIPLANHTVEEPRPGVSAQLTLDADLQWFAEKRIEQAVKEYKAQSGAVVTVDVKSGEILVMANYPTYDPNKPVKNGALGNPAIQQVYEPGSVQKVVTMAALADAGLISLDTKLAVPGALSVQGRTIRDHFDHGQLKLTMAGVIAKSSNIGTIIAAQQMPRPEFVAYLHKFGFGEPSGINFPGESRGLMPPGDEWSELTRSNVAFGQGLSASAVQMAAAVNTVANGGVYVPPKLVKDYVDLDGKVTPNSAGESRRVVSESAAKQVTTMMEAVTGKGGTATKAAIPGYRVAGKTGTAQEVDSACGCYRKWATSFAGFAPADNPRFVTYVVLQNPTNGRSGGGQGGPVFRDVMSYALQKYVVPPTGSKPPTVPLTW
ncbi:MAG TPA: penicillin-binding transpeptidase domain-containing protein [Kribbella sp.]|nr:penicillin-binding transpeptidase domain-containing protein [Kribbella sp.]